MQSKTPISEIEKWFLEGNISKIILGIDDPRGNGLLDVSVEVDCREGGNNELFITLVPKVL